MTRRVGLFLACGLLLPLTVVAPASGQGSTLLVDVAEPTPGQAITVTGGFGGAAPSSAVEIRLSTRSGPLLATAPVTSGRISATFPVPRDLAPGRYLLVATRTTTANGRSAPFAPGRVLIRVRAAGSAGAAGPGGGGGLPDSPLGLLALGSALALLATGATLGRRALAHNRPAASRRVGG